MSDRMRSTRIDSDARTTNGPARRRGGSVRWLAAVLVVLAPMACKKVDDAELPPSDNEATSDVGQGAGDAGATAEQGAGEADAGEQGTGDQGSEGIDPEIAMLAPVLAGSWRSTGPDGCTEVVLDLARSSQGKFFNPSRERSRLHELRRLDDNAVGGIAQGGGPYGDCGEPRRAGFAARPGANADLLDIHWMCLEDGVLIRSEHVEYQRGSCRDSIATAGDGDTVVSSGDDAGVATGAGDGAGTTGDGEGAVTTCESGTDDHLVTSMDGPILESSGGGDGERRRCQAGQYNVCYEASPERCGRCEDSCRPTCEQANATLLGSCRLCGGTPDGGTCGHCMKTCLFL